MLGAIIGDLAGTKYEYQEFLDSRNGVIDIERRKSILDKKTDLITEESFFSDDTLLTIAIADAIIHKKSYKEVLKQYGRKYGNTPITRKDFFSNAFSPAFIKWANLETDENGTSKGNGAAMRVSPVAFLFDNLSQVQEEAKKTAIPSHNSESAITGAQCLASCIYLGRRKESKENIKKYLTEKYQYNFDYDLEELQRNNTFKGTCEETVPQAIFIFLNSNDFEDSIRKAISIGGDTDTIACMTGSISEAYYGIPKELRDKALKQLTPEIQNILVEAYKLKKENSMKDQECR